VITQAIKQNNLDPMRVVYLETGDLNALLDQASGTVLVNSTVGLSSIQACCPTIALGTAIYDMPGLTYQGKLDTFWQDALDDRHKPDAKLVDAFCHSVIALTQINGDFYTRKGINLAVSGSVERLISLPQSDLYFEQNNFDQQVYNKT
jgi:capsular polysaccharide export protein